MAEKIGFVGVGRMGSNMARRLKESGYEIAAVYDVNAAAAEFRVTRSKMPKPEKEALHKYRYQTALLTKFFV